MTNLSKNQTSENKIYWVAENIIADSFPPVDTAISDPDGLLAIGGDLSPERLIDAYKSGIFPWYSKGQPILWWSPDPRCILLPNEVHVSKSLKKTINSGRYYVTFNQAFNTVINECAAPRKGIPDTWITDEIIDAYSELESKGYIISAETWLDGKIIGGLYGVQIGQTFFGESMFSHERDASKVALVALTQKLIEDNFKLMDCQIYSRHLQSLGAKTVRRAKFTALLQKYCYGAGEYL